MTDTPSNILIDTAAPQITRITLNRPAKRNALDIATLKTLKAAFQAAESDRPRRVIILSGAGAIFCAGLDLSEAADPKLAHSSATALCEAYETICASTLITIAAVQGAALGGGVGLVLACDLAIAEPNAQIGFPEVRRGIIAALVTALLRRQLGDRSARELILLGQSIDAPRAKQLGLVNEIALAQAGADELARQALLAAPGAVIRTKKLLDELALRSVATDLRRALALHVSARVTDEFAEGLAAFKEKRPPRWGPRPEA
jgi:methylglutaconyl-CoA hydratase